MCGHAWLSCVNVYILFQASLLCFEPCCKIPPHWQCGVTAVEMSEFENSPFSYEEDEG